MRRIAAGLACVGLAASASFARADGNDPPPLTPPVTGSAPDPKPVPEAATTPPARPSTRPGQVLVLPGITTPRRSSRPVQAAPRTSSAAGGLPPLLESSEAPTTTAPPTSSRNSFRPFGGDDPFAPTGRPTGRPPITLESIPKEGEAPSPDDLTPPIAAPTRRASEGPSRNPSSSGILSPRRPPGWFGRLFPPPGTSDRRGSTIDDSVRVEPRSDPAADAALKRRIERQIHDNFGPKLRSFEVRVVGREVVIRAHPARFWQRRGLRGGLEALPSLRGSHAKVEVLD